MMVLPVFRNPVLMCSENVWFTDQLLFVLLKRCSAQLKEQKVVACHFPTSSAYAVQFMVSVEHLCFSKAPLYLERPIFDP